MERHSSRISQASRPFPQQLVSCRKPYSSPGKAKKLSSTTHHNRRRLRDSPTNSRWRRTACQKMECTLDVATLPLAPNYRSARDKFASRYRKKDGRCRAQTALSDEWSQSLCPHSPRARCRFYREGAAEEQAIAQANQTPAPCRTAKSPRGGCLPLQWPDEKSCAAHRAEAERPCAR